MSLLRLLIPRGHAPRCCGAQPMEWDVLRSLYVCWTCGATR
ncbi:hypothetical protein [Nocardiopsis tropica]|uniref:Uncharacterized protein n=1 Tax=Nocardiopsis tropica TaxID=109330 RepID=A0ABV2A4T8_9ACTN